MELTKFYDSLFQNTGNYMFPGNVNLKLPWFYENILFLDNNLPTNHISKINLTTNLTNN